jgi:hypothetical protein
MKTFKGIKMVRKLFSLPVWTIAAATALATPPQVQAAEWTDYRNEKFGYSLLYPADIFAPAPAQSTQSARLPDHADEGGRSFRSHDGRARLVVLATPNSDFTPEEYRETILKEFKGYDRVTYGPKGKTWFVLSGFRDNDIYYQKVMFSCANKIINALSISFPAAEKPLYAPLVERMEDNFKPGCPAGEKSSRSNGDQRGRTAQ